MIYISTACIKNRYICETVKQLAEAGFRAIELSGGTEWYEGIEDDLVFLKKKYDLSYACHAYFPPPKEHFVVNLASCNNEIYQRSIRHYENCVRLLTKIGCASLSIHAGFLIEIKPWEIGKKLSNAITYKEEKAYDQFVRASAHISKLCDDSGIHFYIENNVLSRENYNEFDRHNYMMLTDYDSYNFLRELMDFNLLLDMGHLNVSSNTLGYDYREQCRELKPYIRWVHISHNNGIEDQHLGLIPESSILNEFASLQLRNVNVTLETVCSMEEISYSKRLIEEVYI